MTIESMEELELLNIEIVNSVSQQSGGAIYI